MSNALAYLFDRLIHLPGRLWEGYASILLEWGSAFSLAALTSAAFISVATLIWRRHKRRPHARPLTFKVLWRAMYPARIWKRKSTYADFGFMFLNTASLGALISTLIMTSGFVTHMVRAVLTHMFGVTAVLTTPGWLGSVILTVAAFLAYDFGYWVDHYLKHKVAFLWPFHRVHHTAEVLTPFTNFRVHPVDTLIFGNILSISIGTVGGITGFIIGGPAQEITLTGTNVIIVAGLFTFIHLQHSHIHIALSGKWGRILFSPAHHHIHHSVDPEHHGCNFGSCLAIWDGLFRTLRLPDAAPPRLKFGVETEGEDPHSATGSLIHPFILSIRSIWPKRWKSRAPAPSLTQAE